MVLPQKCLNIYTGAIVVYGGWKLSGLGVEECFEEMKSYARLKNINMKW